ncbi:PglD-related sugar-binding protein [Duganella levis]|uniref:PglD N-terminal domain-containing protein n=1 Tax=Duganella levis TaxID=2692169 RepID=A0ABW9W731_9BURK|nr:hypothetical protein [Duganella levis]MYN29781.1 hypothetical protein [Duganella levis]
MMDVVIFGAGGLGREICDTLDAINAGAARFTLRGFIDEVKAPGSLVNGVPVLGGAEALAGLAGQVGIILGIAAPAARQRLHQQYRGRFAFPNVLHPSALVSAHAGLGEAILVQAYCIVAANAALGDGVMMNAHSGVGHDAQVAPYCAIMSYCDLAGNVQLGELSFVGTGAKVIPSTVVGAESYLCAGAVVFKSVGEKSKLMGNPAKIIG